MPAMQRHIRLFLAAHALLVAVAIFGGVVDPRKLSFPFNHMPASDARDWEAIHAWTDEVADLLAEEVPVPA